jgi:hypothetical protein
MTVLLRFANLKARGIVNNWPTLARWIAREGFPPGHLIAANTRVWTEAEIDEWLMSKPTAKKPIPLGPGRPRKVTAPSQEATQQT